MKWFHSKKKESLRKKKPLKKKIDYSDLIDFEKISEADIDQCLRDWGRSADKFFIVGEEETKSLRDICAEEGIEEPLEMDADQLRMIWKKYILDRAFGSEKANVMMDHFEKTMHQDGYLYMLQADYFDACTEKDFMFSSDQVNHQVTLFVDSGRIGIIESFQVMQYIGIKARALIGDGSYPLVAALGEYSLDFEGMTPKCEVVKAILDFKEDFSRSLLEEDEVQFKENIQPNPRV